MKIKDVVVRKIFDSRGEPTVEVALWDGSGRFFAAQVPSGKSRGSGEAAVLPYLRARLVVKNILRRALRRRVFNSIRKLDKFLLKLDGMPDKSKLGGNVMLGISMAAARSLASEKKQKLWQTLQCEFFEKNSPKKSPLIFSNLINGGAHAANNLDIQEYMVVVKVKKHVAASIEQLVRFYGELGSLLKRKYHLSNLPLGDEGGYSLNFKNNFEPLRILELLIREMRLTGEFAIGLDVAAMSLYENGRYRFEGRQITEDELGKIYRRYLAKSKLLFSIEDPFSESGHDGFSRMTAGARDRLIVGDDLTTTSPTAIESCAREGLINAVIIKPNQIGTVSEACEAINVAHKNHIKCIVSHRSGETADNFIIHLARAGNVFGLKIGAPARERISKFNELIKIYGDFLI